MRAVHAASIALCVAACACIAVDEGSPISHEPATTHPLGVDHGVANDRGDAVAGEPGTDLGDASDPGGGGEQGPVSYAVRACYDAYQCLGDDACLDAPYGSYLPGRCYTVCGAHGAYASYFHGVRSCSAGSVCVRYNPFLDVCRPTCAVDDDCLAIDRCAPIDAGAPKLGSVCVPRSR